MPPTPFANIVPNVPSHEVIDSLGKQMSEEKKATDQYLELYKLAVEMADRTSARRASMFTFPFTANTALFAVVLTGDFEVAWLMVVVGLAISLSWWVLLKSYRDLSMAKFRVITEMEENLAAQIFTEESKSIKHTQLGTLERVVPLIFAALFVMILVAAII
jgi:hypothetical protein